MTPEQRTHIIPREWADGNIQPPKKRPWWCQDPTCQPDYADSGAQHGSFKEQPGLTGFCCGRVPEPLTFDRHGVHHENDGHFCFRSAIRGVVMLEVNGGDLDIMARVALHSQRYRGQREFNMRWYTGADNPPTGGEADATD